MSFYKKPGSIFLAAGVLLGLPFLFELLWWLFIPGLILLLEGLRRSQNSQRLFWLLLLTGSLKAGAAVMWFWSTYPIDWVGVEPGPGQLLIILIYWGTVSVSIGVGFALSFFVFSKILIKNPKLIYFFPVFLVFSEILGSLTFSIYSIGPGSVPNINFGFGYLGYLLITPGFFNGLATWGGVYLLSLVAGMIGLVTHQYIFNKNKSLVIFIIAIIFLTLFSNWQLKKIAEPQNLPSVVIIDTKFDSGMFVDNQSFFIKSLAVSEAVKEALLLESDIILLPEDSRFIENFDNSQEALEFIKKFSNREVIVVDSARVVDDGGEVVLRAFIFDTANDEVYEIDKEYLVPQGEFVPYLASLVINLVGSKDLSETLNKNISYRPGQKTSYEHIPSTIPGVLFCMESVSPIGVAKIMGKRDFPMVLHPISHGWFNEPDILWFNLERMLVSQALWNQVTIIEAANQAPSKAYSPQGGIITGTKIKTSKYWNLIKY